MCFIQCCSISSVIQHTHTHSSFLQTQINSLNEILWSNSVLFIIFHIYWNVLFKVPHLLKCVLCKVSHIYWNLSVKYGMFMNVPDPPRPSAPRRWGLWGSTAPVTVRPSGRWWRRSRSANMPNTPVLSVERWASVKQPHHRRWVARTQFFVREY